MKISEEKQKLYQMKLSTCWKLLLQDEIISGGKNP